jgi:DNA polymerase II large subunit
MKKFLAVFTAVLVVSLVACGSGGKYGDVKDFIKEMIAAQDSYISSVEKAKSPDDIVKAIENFGERFIALADTSVELKKKYPDIDKWDNNPPAELKADFEKVEKSSEKMEKIFMNENVRQHMMDPKVLQAFMDLGKKLEATKFFE